ncbi:putative accessory gene regulator protein [Pelotomaculum schinkii]|uniref:Putative accessory gene regulator protein n=1 Tax=Pelotomaculum schinkii TaxID=78350 RepID=A0A4Y7RAH0_9FIRM|nr:MULTISPECIES: accessory gene regulator B family protein [Pelotomaculum]TEB05792.1 putative accessory gene regulator protein [Pelotomaculum schinkii]TEB17959.1 putative accessory gene regulator protein [Pelotomaculum sp. FP]
MMKAFARRIAVTMGTQLQVERAKIDIFAYGLEIILGTLVQLTLLILLSFIIGAFKTTMVCLVAFASLRYFGGGTHLSTYSGCLIVGTALLLGLGKLAMTIDVSLAALTGISALTILTGIYIILRWAPAGTEKKQIKDESMRLRQRNKALFVLTVCSAVTMVLIQHELTVYAFAAVLGTLGSLFLITPWGYRAVKALDNIPNIFLRG